jgi:hypothetical protein
MTFRKHWRRGLPRSLWFFAHHGFSEPEQPTLALQLCFKLPAKPMRLGGRHQIGQSRDFPNGATRRTKFGWRMEGIFPWLAITFEANFLSRPCEDCNG